MERSDRGAPVMDSRRKISFLRCEYRLGLFAYSLICTYTVKEQVFFRHLRHEGIFIREQTLFITSYYKYVILMKTDGFLEV